MVFEEISLVKDLPILSTVIILGYIIYIKTQQLTQKNQEWTQKNEEVNQQRYADLIKNGQDKYDSIVKSSQEKYEELSNKFVDTMKTIVADNTKCLTNLCEKMDENNQKLDSHTRSKEEFIQMIKQIEKQKDDLYDMLKESIRHGDKKQ